MPGTTCCLAPLPNLGAITVTGADAAEFLAAQLSQAPPEAGLGRAPLAAWHDAKGRVQALCRVVCHDDGYLLITHRSVVDEVAASLRRYILRAEVTIDIAADLSCATLLGDSASWLAEQRIDLGTEAGAIVQEREVAWLRLGPRVVHVVGAHPTIERLAAELPRRSEDDAELAEIRLGIPTVSTKLRGQFLPQMLNLDVLGGVAFDKGCYPGQEIIARAQNLGTIKRRMLRFSIESCIEPPAVGSALTSEPGQTVGVVIRSARSEHGVELLAVARLDADQDSLACEQSSEITLKPETLPYSIPGN